MNTNFILKTRKTTEDTEFFTGFTEIFLRVLGVFSVVKKKLAEIRCIGGN
jgi:hypothetical protein